MSEVEIVIKTAMEDDIPVLSRVALQAYRDHYLHLWYDSGEWYMQKSFSEEQFALELKDSNARFYIISNNEKPAGFLKINLDAPLDGNANALELERIYFTEECSGKGIGTKTVDYVFQLAAELKKDLVWLKVMDSSAGAIAFYKKHGFDVCGTCRLDFSQMKNELRGMYVMKCPV